MIKNIDDSILLLIQSHLRNEYLDSFFVFITSLGNSGFLFIVTGFILFSFKRYRKYGMILLLSLLFSNILGEHILKPFFARIRPCNVNSDIFLLIHKPGGYSFPSGHTMNSFASATVLYKMNKKFGISAYILAVLIGFSRLYLFVHYPTDVLTGAILGVFTAYFVLQSFDTCFLEKSTINQHFSR